MLLVEFILFCSVRMGLKFAKNKTIIMSNKFQFLGHTFKDSAISIPENKRNNFQKMRPPRSQAECISRLASISYFENTLPQLRKVAIPLFDMVKSDNFKWTEVENNAWEAMKMLISLEFENTPLDPEKPLFCTVDASQVACCYLLFQLCDEGFIRMVYTKSKIFDLSTRNKPSVLRELTGLLYLLIQEEHTIKNHLKRVFILTDCSSLSYLQRNRYSNHKLSEMALYISTFQNINIFYTPGTSLFWSDLLSRQYNEVFMGNDKMKISQEWAKMVPYISSHHVGKLMSTEHLMDFLFARPNAEVIDCFSKYTVYNQNLNRYHKLKTIPKGRIPAEIDFLVEVFAAWNKPTMSQTQFVEVQRAIENFPATELQKIKTKLDLKNLRSELLKLNMNEQLWVGGFTIRGGEASLVSTTSTCGTIHQLNTSI